MDAGLPVVMQVVIAGKVVLAAAYLTAAIRHLREFVKQPGNPRARDPNVLWYLRSLIALAAVAVASVVIGLLPAAGVGVPIDSDALGTLFICGSIYLVSFLLIRHPLVATLHTSTLAQRMAPRASLAKYMTSPLTAPRKQEVLDRLVRHMEAERPFLDMNLTLEKLAEALEVRPAHLSQVLNERAGASFYEFVSTYRVREAESRIADPARNGKTLLAIAHESGFNSKASFNRAFKRVTGHTPSDYARLHTSPDDA
jgi:AraC-like DNA-binding protein